jgi:hypothetical protein
VRPFGLLHSITFPLERALTGAILPLSTGSSLCLAAWDEREGSIISLPGFDTRMMPPKKVVRMGDEGCVLLTALLFVALPSAVKVY